jgi:riboflavin biosynthesis pyrimidine reductase
MVTIYPKIPYDYDRIRLNKIFENPKVKDFPNVGIQTENSIKVFGEVRFPELPEDRAYTMACFVTSIDGKIAYSDNPAGPVIAQGNQMDPDGATADFWVLNLMRASVDAIFAGAVTMQKEPNGLCGIFDQELEDERVRNGMSQAPWVIVCSLDGTDIPFNDTLLENQPVMFNTSPNGLKVVEKGIKQDYYVVGPYKSIDEIDVEKVKQEFEMNKFKKSPVIITGEGSQTNSKVLLRLLKLMDINKAMVESPSYCHSLLSEGLLDELTFNYSCVYIGGTAVGFGNGMEPNTSVDHPHTEMLSIHSHSPSFFYFRHKLIYGLRPEGYLGSVY